MQNIKRENFLNSFKEDHNENNYNDITVNVLIINTLPIPSGQASVNRILSLSKGMIEAGDNVTILSTALGEDTDFHFNNNIRYCNLQKGNNKVFALLQSLFDIKEYLQKNRKEIDVVWLVSNSLLLIYPLWIFCKWFNIKLLQEKSEFPFVLMKKGLIAKCWASFYVHTTYKLFDGMIIMTQPLFDYLKPLVKNTCRLIKIPMTVDTSRFEQKIEKSKYGEYVAYCGYMGGNKDGLENLLEAFTYVERKHPEFKLVLAGVTSSESEFNYLKDKAKALGLKNVLFIGRVNREDIPSFLGNAKILCLARPSSLQSSGGFPTKLGEYLCTGNPVVVTAVGEIPSFLDRINSFIIPPDDNKKFGETINEILENYDYAKQVAQKGRDVVFRHFDYKVQAARLHDFLYELKTI